MDIRLFLLHIILISQLLQFTYANANEIKQKKEHSVLVLHSYHQGLEWTDNITSGILSVMDKRPEINLVFEYLDAKRNYNDEYFKAIYDLYRVKAKQIPFDAIIVSDNAAYIFIKKYGNEFYPNIPVVFCGINNLDTADLKHYPNFLGFGEKADHYGTISSIKKIFPEKKKVLIINDNTLTGRAIRNELTPVLKEFESQLNFKFLSDFTLESLQRNVRTLDDSYVIYLLVINRDKNGRFISYRNGISKIKEESNVPIFGSWDFYEKKGLFGGKITRGYEQGKHVAKLVEKIVDGNLPDSIRQFSFIENSYVFDYQEMLKFEISKNQLPAGSTIINEPDKDKDVLKVTIAAIILLWLVVMVLAVRLKIRKARAAELEKLVMERTALLNKTNDELANIIMNKDKFFSLLAHDLRNLVGAFLNCMQILNSEVLTLSKEKTKKLSIRAQEVANQTYELLEDLLYWGIRQFRGEQEQTLNISSFNIEDVFTTIIEKYKVNCANVNIITDIEDELLLESDKDICKFIFRNILVNAIKYSKENGNIYIKGYSQENKVCVIIQDKGIGMSAEIIESIYNRVPIRKNAGKGKDSTGLGLPSALEYLEMLKGVLLIESEPGKGSSFTIEFPESFE